MTKDTKHLWTVEQVADYLQMSEKAVRRRVERDAIPYLKAGRSLRFDPHQIREWLEAA